MVFVPFSLGAGTRASLAAPGDPTVGKGLFIAFCGKCHTMAAAGSRGTLGPNLDQDRVTFSAVVSAIEQGVGGIQAEYILRFVTFNELYDIAKFVAVESDCAHPASGCRNSSESV
jgi:hypothetical protein